MLSILLNTASEGYRFYAAIYRKIGPDIAIGTTHHGRARG
jgi:hypothetical protein